MDTITTRMRRRRLFAFVAGGCGAAILVGCGAAVPSATSPPQPTPPPAAPTAAPVTGAVNTGAAGGLTLVLTIKEGPEPLRNPNACAIDRDGSVFIGDSDSTVKKFDAAGKFLMQWGTPGEGGGQFNLISGLALDAQGNVYVADFSNTRLQVFDKAGRFLRVIATEPPVGPVAVAIDGQGNIVAVNHRTHDHYLQKFDPNGKPLLAWASNGTGPGEIAAGARTGPEAVAVDAGGNIYVGDSDNFRVQKFDPNGKHLLTFGSRGEADDQFRNGPSGIALDGAGNIYVADKGPILKFDPAGKLIVRWVGRVDAPSGFFTASRVLTVDGAGNVYIANGLNNAIQKFRQG